MAEPKIRFKRDDGNKYPEWQTGKLSDITEKVDRKAPKGSDAPIMMVSQGNGFIYQADKYSRENAGQSLKNYTLLKQGEFAYNHGASKAKPYGVAYCLREEPEARVPFVYHTFRIINGINAYWHEALNTCKMDKKLKRMVSSGVRMDGLLNINYETYMNADIDTPCLEEQQKIADFLLSLDEVIVSSEAEVQNLETQKKIVMKKIFSQEVRFKREDGTDFPEWREDSLSNLCEYVDYRGKTPEKVNSGIFLITAKNIRMGYIDYDVSQEFVSDDDYDNIMHRGKPAIGDVLFTTEAPCGMVAQVDREDIALAQRVIKYRTADKKVLLNDYLKYVLMSHVFQNDLEKKATGGTVKGIKGAVLHEMLIILPYVEEQYLISDFLAGFDEAIAAAKKELEVWKELKKGLMQQMFI